MQNVKRTSPKWTGAVPLVTTATHNSLMLRQPNVPFHVWGMNTIINLFVCLFIYMCHVGVTNVLGKNWMAHGMCVLVLGVFWLCAWLSKCNAAVYSSRSLQLTCNLFVDSSPQHDCIAVFLFIFIFFFRRFRRYLEHWWWFSDGERKISF